MISTVYTILNCLNNKIYVGKTINFQKRKREHLLNLRKKIHPNYHLQNAVNKYGIENFEFEILEECEEQFLHSQEHYWCNLLNVFNMNFGYNIQKTNPELNKHQISQETKDKISLANKGSNSNLGYKHSDDFKQKMSLLSSNRTQITKNKIANTLKKNTTYYISVFFKRRINKTMV